MIFTR